MNILEAHHGWDEDEPGGIVAMIRDLIDGLEGRGHHVILMANDWSASVPTLATDREGREYWRFSMMQPPARLSLLKAWAGWMVRFPRAVRHLRRFCREHRIDIAHVHYASPLYLLFAINRALGGVPFVVTTHRGDVLGYPELTPVQRFFFRRVLGAASAINSVSRHLAGVTGLLVPGGKPVVTIHNGFTPSALPLATREVLLGEFGLKLPEHYAVMVGNCRHYKGFDVAVEAWALLAKRGCDIPLVVVGGGPDLESLQALVGLRGLGDRVCFLGALPRHVTISLSALAQLQVVPSRNEGQGIVVLEAGHVGTPVVCTDIAPFLEMVTPGESATVFAEGDAEALADAVIEVLNEPEKASERARRLAKSVREEFSIPAMIRGYETLFEQTLNARRQ